MSKWANPLDKKTNTNQCYCSSDAGLFVPNRQLSLIVASLLLLMFACFIVGYFFGKRPVLEHMRSSLNPIHSAYEDNSNNNDELAFAELPESIEQSHLDIACSTIANDHNTDEPCVVVESADQFYAELIGFVTEKAARAFSQKLAAKNVETIVKTRVSQTAKGLKHYWYQVVTPAYNDKEMLISLVNRVAKEERLNKKDINIKNC